MHKIKLHLLLLALPLLLLACKEDGQYLLTGKLQYRDHNSGTLLVSNQIKSQILQGPSSSDTLQILSEKTGEGFSFGPLSAGEYSLLFRFNDTVDGKIRTYSKDTVIKLEKIKLPDEEDWREIDLGTFTLETQPDEEEPSPAPVLKVMATNNQGNPVPFGNFLLFNNPDFLGSDPVGANAIAKAPSNSTGVAHLSLPDDIPPPYFIEVNKDINGTAWNNLFTGGTSEFTLPIPAGDTGTISIAIQPTQPAPKTVLEITVKDTLNGLVNNAEVFLYSSSIFLGVDPQEDNALFTKTTDAEGRAYFSPQGTGPFFVEAEKVVGDTTYNNLFIGGVDTLPFPIIIGDTTRQTLIIKP